MNDYELKKVISKGISNKIDYLNNQKAIFDNTINDIGFTDFKISISDPIFNENLEKYISEMGENINIIYQFYTHQLPMEINELDTHFNSKKQKDGKYSQINKKHRGVEYLKKADKDNHYCLYIGKSKKIKDRITQHIGINKSRSVYSLYLKDWWPQENPTIGLIIYNFKNNISSDLLQIIEDVLWEEYKPLFGKQGANNIQSHTM